MGTTPEEEFQDPLEDYSEPHFDDPLEQKLHNDTVSQIQSAPFTAVPSDQSVAEVMAKMTGDDIACVLVEENGKLVGLFSDRDVLDKVALDFENMKSRPVRDVMTREPVYVQESDSAAATLTVVAVSGYRHIPVLNADEQIVGIISPRRIAEYLTASFG